MAVAATRKLYLDDSYLRKFTATVLALRARPDGKPSLLLDQTAFYAESGGQPGDHGRIGAFTVVDTQDVDGQIDHILAPDPALSTDGGPLVGSTVECEVDWRRRHDHMQQHHGQHILSAAFESVASAPTLAFHIGDDVCTIDVAAPADRLTAAVLADVEARANETIWSGLEVEAREYGADEIAALHLRKPPTKGCRIVRIPGVDASACGGTHPRRTSEVGCVLVLKAARWEGKVSSRVTFVCGARALRAAHAAAATTAAAAAALKCAAEAVPAEATRVGGELVAQRAKSAELLEALAGVTAASLAAAAVPGAGVRVVVAEVPPHGGAAMAASFVQLVARKCAVDNGVAAAIAAVVPAASPAGAAAVTHLAAARPKGVGAVTAKEALAAMAAASGGKGGGAPDSAQGQAAGAVAEAALAAARVAFGVGGVAPRDARGELAEGAG